MAFILLRFVCGKGSSFPSHGHVQGKGRGAFEILTFISDSYFFPHIIRRSERYDACCDNELLHAGSECGIEDAGRTGDSSLEQRKFSEVREQKVCHARV